MSTLMQDLRFALRQFRKVPAFTLTAVLTLALGIGANTAIFSVVNAFLFKAPAVPNPSQIVTLAYHQNNADWQGTFSLPEFKEIRAQSSKSFSDVIASTVGEDGLAVEGQKPERILTGYVSGNYFSSLATQPALGRLFQSAQGDNAGQDPEIVLSYDFWQQKFNGNPAVVGRQVTLDGHALTVIGVAPQGFAGLFRFASFAAFVPLSELIIEGTPADLLNSWQNRNLGVQGRLRPGVSLKQAEAEMKVAAQNIARQHPEAEKSFDIAVFPGPRLRVPAFYVVSALFLGLAGMVLLLACVNVANLVLVRATDRESEMAIRMALGAQSSRLLRQMLTESVALAVAGGAMGIFLGMWVSTALGRLDLHTGLPITISPQFDWHILLFSFAIALLAGFAVGVIPALRLRKGNVNSLLHEGSRSVTGRRHWLRDTLVTLQVSGSLVLLVVAGLFVRSLIAFQTTDLGFKPDDVLNLSIDTSEIGMADTQSQQLADSILTRLHAMPGVEFVSHASATPMGVLTATGGDTVLIDGAPAPPDGTPFSAAFITVSSEYFQVMGIDIQKGRCFTDADNAHSRGVAVISQSMAKKYWPDKDPIGRTFRLGQEKDRVLEVVGIAQDAEFTPFDGGKSRPTFYLPYAQHVSGNHLMVFQVKTNRDPMGMATAVSKTIQTLAPQLPVFQVETQRQGLYTLNGLLIFRAGAVLAAIMGGVGLTLAVIGLYGVIAYAVSQRLHEIGLRMALGASRGSVFKMIYRQSMRLVAVGLGVGLVAAMLVARAVGSFVLVSAWDPATYATVLSALVLAALASCYLPARHAMAVEPTTAMRGN